MSIVFSSPTVYTERTYSHPQSGSGALVVARRRGSCREQGSVEWALFKVSTLLIMSGCEEDLGDFPTFSAENRTAESMVGAYRTESTDQWTAASGITTKISPLFDGPTSWFKYEELIDDWLDLTMLEAGKRGPALKNRVVGDAEMHKGLLNREPLRGQPAIGSTSPQPPLLGGLARELILHG